MKEYITVVAERTVSEEIINKSKFISHCYRADSVKDVEKILSELKVEYKGATHFCSAYVIGTLMKYDDDGEPTGTAGLPILDCIKKQKVDHVLVVVVRYFGGIKLGAGGLLRAYSGGCSAVLTKAVKVTFKKVQKVTVAVSYPMLKYAERSLRENATLLNVDYLDVVTLSCKCLSSDTDKVIDAVVNATNGDCDVKKTEIYLDEFESESGEKK